MSQDDKFPPMHMSICQGPILCKDKATASSSNPIHLDISRRQICVLCAQNCSVDNYLCCLGSACQAVTHIRCLAQRFLGLSDHVIPIDGECPACGMRVLWGDLIRKKNGCYNNLAVANT